MSVMGSPVVSGRKFLRPNERFNSANLYLTSSPAIGGDHDEIVLGYKGKGQVVVPVEFHGHVREALNGPPAALPGFLTRLLIRMVHDNQLIDVLEEKKES